MIVFQKKKLIFYLQLNVYPAVRAFDEINI